MLVHCSDGWDRTPQIVSLAQIMLDPYYRSIDGFRTLVEICWLDFGHKMADRNGTSNAGADPNERAPIFLQVSRDEKDSMILRAYTLHIKMIFFYFFSGWIAFINSFYNFLVISSST